MGKYITLIEALTYCFEERGITVKEIKVENGAKRYTIEVSYDGKK